MNKEVYEYYGCDTPEKQKRFDEAYGYLSRRLTPFQLKKVMIKLKDIQEKELSKDEQ